MKSKKFPKQLFVVDRDGQDQYYVADNSVESFDDGEDVAVYELVAIKKKVVEHSLEDK